MDGPNFIFNIFCRRFKISRADKHSKTPFTQLHLEFLFMYIFWNSGDYLTEFSFFKMVHKNHINYIWGKSF